MMPEIPYKFPSFNDLPKIPGTPQGALWGFYDRAGDGGESVRDEVGGKFEMHIIV